MILQSRQKVKILTQPTIAHIFKAMRHIFIASVVLILVGVTAYNAPEGTFSAAEHERITSAKMYKSEALVLAAKDCYVVYTEAAEKEIGKTVSGYQWLGEENHPSNIRLSSSRGYTGFMFKVEQGLTRVVFAGLIFRKEGPVNSDSVTIQDIASKLSDADLKKLEAKAKKIVAGILSSYKRTQEQVSLAGTMDLVKSYPIPKEPRPETWHTLFQGELASNSQ